MKGRVVGCRSEVERGNCLRCHGYSYFLCADDGLVETIFLVHIRLGMNWDLWLGWAKRMDSHKALVGMGGIIQ